jgi:hypothetical protein
MMEALHCCLSILKSFSGEVHTDSKVQLQGFPRETNSELLLFIIR